MIVDLSLHGAWGLVPEHHTEDCEADWAADPLPIPEEADEAADVEDVAAF
jgi:hypothetical protein